MPNLARPGKVKRAHRTRVRRRRYQLQIRVVDSSTDIDRQTILAPSPGRRIRFIRTRVLQEASDGRHLWELFFGSAGNMITAPNRAIDVLVVPDVGKAATRTYLRGQGPKGKRDEVLSGRWLTVVAADCSYLEGHGGESTEQGLVRLNALLEDQMYPGAEVWFYWEGGNDITDFIQETDPFLFFSPTDADYPFTSAINSRAPSFQIHTLLPTSLKARNATFFR